MVSIYDAFMAPLEKMGIKKARRILLKEPNGKVLEIGAGTGVNIKYYDFNILDSLILSDIDFDKRLLKRIRNFEYKEKIETKILTTLDLPFDDNSFDYVVHTLVFCSVSDVDKGLEEIMRVLKPSGTLVFIEHILPERNPLKKMFDFVTPAWKKIAMGCHLNRDFIKSLITNGFEIINYEKFMRTAFVYGKAKPKK